MARVNLDFLLALESSVTEIATTGWTNWKSSHETDEWYRQIFERLAYDAVEECNTGITPFCEWRVAIDTHYQDQEIPAEWAQWYEWYLQAQRSDGSIRHQQPEHVGSVPSQYKTLLGPDGSPLQREIRNTFLKACECWNMQPATEGAIPPEIGPRARTWWYEHAVYKYPSYRNWFMATTIITYMGEETPDWCKWPYLFIGDSGNHRIMIRDCNTLKYLSQLGTFGSGDDELNNPTGVTSDEDYFYICDTYNHRIVQRKIIDRSYVDQEGTLGDGDDQFFNPADITSDEEYLYIADDDNHRIKKHDKSNLAYVAKAGTQGSGNDYFNHPYAITCDKTYLYICDSLNNRIKKYRKDNLVYVSKAGTEGSGDNQFSSPMGITCDDTYLYICDTGNNRIKKHLKWSLTYVAKIGTQGSGDDQFDFPTQIVCDETYLYICDTANYRIKKHKKSDLSFVKDVAGEGSGDDEFNLPIGIHATGWLLSTLCNDTYVSTEWPDINLSYEDEIHAIVWEPTYGHQRERTYIKINKEESYTLHLYVALRWDSTGQNRELGIYEVDPDLFDILTVTWNNQPGTIRLISSILFKNLSTGWNSFAIDHAKALCLRSIDESEPPWAKSAGAIFISSRGGIENRRPYITV